MELAVAYLVLLALGVWTTQRVDSLRLFWSVLVIGAWITLGGVALVGVLVAYEPLTYATVGLFALLPLTAALHLTGLFKTCCVLMGLPVWLMLLAIGIS